MKWKHSAALSGGVKTSTKNRQRCALLFSLLLLTGMLISTVCDLAISGRLSWSLFPLLSIPFCWLVFFPAVRLGRKGIGGGLLALSLLILPFLHGLDRLIRGSASILPVGGRMAAIGVVLLWIVFALFRLLKKRKLLAAAVSCLTVVLGCVAVNLTLSGMLGSPVLDRWDLLSFLVLAVLSSLFFLLDLKAQKAYPH